MIESRFHAMGTDAHVIVVGGEASDLACARNEIDRLERLWSRFQPDSEISALNAAAGAAVRASRETIALVGLACEGREATGGLFDPTVLGSLVALGYDRTFDEIDARRAPIPIRSGSDAIVIDDTNMTVTLAAGSRGFDPGGIGKGYAADLVVQSLMERRDVRGACVNVGGDLRAAGEGPGGDPWIVEVEHPIERDPVGRIALGAGAIATTSRMRRRWRQGDADRHHVIDPRTGLPAETGLASVTVVAGEAWWAEVVAKAAFLAGASDIARVMRDADVEGIAVNVDGSVLVLGDDGLLVA